ncbi:DUF3010 family protein [Agarivorans sp. B2Z047]|uniref:DUF3010 domain-containing protein n=1 Tax=Agarivorans albus MKT 106 TaxID=1331007 RepID=R9PJ21_AGAAL|nr:MULTISPECIES: DUF3010 family protein [Agarivorans]MPW29471.1 DUF3010 family protein [Agarivorans sp. B2Z047]UQN45060.1 DUF3010 family protein [Agarivorans sp. B2Z047]GAD01369.1 hypothetical protein AALB_1449 [Agarivorans albus MKT 106]
MKVCGVEIKSNEVIVSLLTLEDGLFQIPDCRVRRLTLSDINSTQHLRDFQFAFAKLMSDYKVEKVAIKQRPMKGKFAGGAVGFKLEAAIELISELNVDLVSATKSKQVLKDNPMPVEFSATGLKAFQETSFTTAYVACMA